MPKTPQLPLFDDAEDQASIAPRQMKDDVEFKKERRRNRKTTKPMPPPPANGPCCSRCQNWHAPRFEDQEYGECRVLYVASERKLAYNIDKGEVHDRVSLRNAGVAGEPLRTGPGFTCSACQPLGEERGDI